MLVVGGGITGAGAALDAASRGLRVALVEAEDFANGASSQSSKLIHGGLRYLEMLDFGLVREALGERRSLMETVAPHLVRPVEFLMPLRHRVWERAYLTTGLALYDSMASRGGLPRHRQRSRRGLRRSAPALDGRRFVGGLSFHDASEDDARMVITVVRTAAMLGAATVSGARATTSAVEGSTRVVEVVLDDGRTVSVRAKHVSYATGAWGDLQGFTTDLRIRPSKGVHLVVGRDRIAADTGIIARTSRGLLFVIPWLGHWLIGDTDTEWPYDRGTPVATSSDVDGILESVNSILGVPLDRTDVVGVFAGVRPLVQGDPRSSTVRLSREHVVASAGPRRTVIAGGKYTTYRLMAADLIDDAVRRSGLVAPPSRTDSLPLIGAPDTGVGPLEKLLADETGLSAAAIAHLVARYGTQAGEVLSGGRYDGEGLMSIAGGPYLWAEIRYAFTHEGARSVRDVLERRTRIKLLHRDGGRSLVDRVAGIGAAQLAWTPEETQKQVHDYLAVLDAEAAALGQTNDEAAWHAYRTALRRT